MKIKGSCHCGAVAYQLAERPSEAIECNCSICRRKGYQFAFVSPGVFHLETDRNALVSYTFGAHVIKHLFCKVCGCSPFCEGSGPEGPMVALNLRCLDDFDPDSITITKVDGASL